MGKSTISMLKYAEVCWSTGTYCGMGQRNPNHQLFWVVSFSEYLVWLSTILGGAGFRNHLSSMVDKKDGASSRNRVQLPINYSIVYSLW
jgi:hypothetical protein